MKTNAFLLSTDYCLLTTSFHSSFRIPHSSFLMNGGMMKFKRSSGILLHPTSLPGRFGVGDLGPAAYEFVEWLAAAGQTFWQIMPLGPTGYGDSPYSSFSAFAGNTNLVSPEKLFESGLLAESDIQNSPDLPSER